MKTRYWFYLCLWLFFASACSEAITNEKKQLLSYVNPLIGSAHCRWFHVAPGALPFGLAKPCPSTNGSDGNPSGWEATGYDYRHHTIEGFPCLHEFQIGGIVLMPTNGELKTIPGKENNIRSKDEKCWGFNCKGKERKNCSIRTCKSNRKD